MPKLRRDNLEASIEDGDLDGDGIKDDDFAFAAFNANLLFRWELSPGTVLIVAYTRAQNRSEDLAGRPPQLELSGLRGARTEEVALIKLTLFL